MTLFYAFVLGVIEGLTEFIPVSSTAHLLLAQRLLNIPADGVAFAFTILVQQGALLALILFFWKDLWHIVSAVIVGLWQRKPFEHSAARLGWYVLLASLPALGVGFLLRNVVKDLFKDPLLEAALRLLLTAFLLALAEWVDKGKRGMDSLNWKDALWVGAAQILAVFPGASRSGSTIAGGMARRFDRPAAARFAFLLSVPVMLAAGVYQTRAVILAPYTRQVLPFLLVGFVAAAIVGWLSIKWLIRYLNHHSLYGFAIYTLILGVLALVLHLWLG
ncbi:MAG: undecaprenyl-diphosphatase UppP [Anaerolineae bacterium]